MGSFIGLMLVTYGLPGVAIVGIIFVEAHARKNEKKTIENDKCIGIIHKDLENINKKLDAITNHFMIKGIDQ